MKNERLGIVVILGVAILVLLYYTTNNTEGHALNVPEFDSEVQLFGLNVSGDFSYNPGTPLDMRPEIHFWAPGYNPRDVVTVGQEPVKSRHCYPRLPGGNVSTVMHKGWSGFMQSAPDKDWFYNPPEMSVLLWPTNQPRHLAGVMYLPVS